MLAIRCVRTNRYRDVCVVIEANHRQRHRTLAFLAAWRSSRKAVVDTTNTGASWMNVSNIKLQNKKLQLHLFRCSQLFFAQFVQVFLLFVVRQKRLRISTRSATHNTTNAGHLRPNQIESELRRKSDQSATDPCESTYFS